MSRKDASGWKLTACACLLLGWQAYAQWLNYPAPGIPRTPDGKPNLSAPAPRTPDGKPDLSGVWNGPGAGSYDRNIAKDLKPADILPWAEALYQQRVRAMGKDAPRANCLARSLLVLSHGLSPRGWYNAAATDRDALPGHHQQRASIDVVDGCICPSIRIPTWIGHSTGRSGRRALPWWSIPRASTIEAGSTSKGTLTPKLCASPNATGGATSDTWIWK